MIIKNEIKGWKLTEELAALLILPIKDILPNMYLSGKQNNWSDWKIVSYVSELDLSQEDYEKIITVAYRCMKISAFT